MTSHGETISEFDIDGTGEDKIIMAMNRAEDAIHADYRTPPSG